MSQKLFEDLKIVDLSWVVTGPLTTKYFSDLGAEVIKVESSGRLDVLRTITPSPNTSAQFNHFNTGKMSVTINLALPKGIELVKKLISRADVVVDNMGAGAIERMGLGYNELKKVNGHVIMLSSCLQGHTGPAASSRGGGDVLSALSGLNEITGWPDREPAEIGLYTDYIGPTFHVLLILAALDYRRRTGKGQYLDVSQFEQAVQFMAPLILDYTTNQQIAKRMGNRLAYAAPHGAYRCKGEDRWCALAVFDDEEWRSFCAVIGNPAWTKESRFNTLAGRKENEDELDKLVEDWTVNYSPEEVMTLMQANGVAAGLLATAEDLMERDPQLKHEGFFTQVNHAELGSYMTYHAGFELSKSPYIMRAAPLLGEHNDRVLKDIIGLSNEEVARLVEEGVVK